MKIIFDIIPFFIIFALVPIGATVLLMGYVYLLYLFGQILGLFSKKTKEKYFKILKDPAFNADHFG